SARRPGRFLARTSPGVPSCCCREGVFLGWPGLSLRSPGRSAHGRALRPGLRRLSPGHPINATTRLHPCAWTRQGASPRRPLPRLRHGTTPVLGPRSRQPRGAIMRPLALLLATAALTTAAASAAEPKQPGGDTVVYVSVAAEKRIAVYQMDRATGKLTHRG